MFASQANTPLNFDNVLNRVILPALNRCEVCRKERSEHVQADHGFKRDALRPEWHAWHAFRRGLATNLHRSGVNDKIIQAMPLERCDYDEQLSQEGERGFNGCNEVAGERFVR